MNSKINSVLDDTFEVRSLVLDTGVVKYDAIRNLVSKLHNNPNQDDIYAAANCIQMLAARLDLYRAGFYEQQKGSA